MKYSLLTFVLCFAIGLGHTQILNPEINVEVRIATYYGNSDNDATTTDEQSMLIVSKLNDGTNSADLNGCSVFDCNTPCTVSEDLVNGPFYFSWVRGWEEDISLDIQLTAWGDEGGSECQFDAGDVDLFEGLASDFNLTNPVITNNRNPIQWYVDFGSNDGFVFDNSTLFNVKPQVIWAHRFGDSCGEPLDFGAIADGETKNHTNSNRSTPGTLMGDAAIGYTNQDAGSYPSPDVFYSFTIEETSMVNLSLVNDGTDYDTYMSLHNADCTALLAFNDDVTDNDLRSFIEMELAPGTYKVLVDGYEMEQGNFELSITANTVVGTSEINTALPITIGPNPTDGLLNMTIGDASLFEDAVLEVYSLQAQLLQRRDLTATSTTLDLGAYPAGTYLVRIITPAGQLTKKVSVY